MTSSTPLSTKSNSSLASELEAFGRDLFGASPVPGGQASVPPAPRLARFMRRFVRPRIKSYSASMGGQLIRVTRNVSVIDPDDPLDARFVGSFADVMAYVAGPSDQTMSDGLLSAGDFEVIVSASEVDGGFGPDDTVSLQGSTFAIVSSQTYPENGAAVFVRLYCKRT